jgi:hypothetical protein
MMSALSPAAATESSNGATDRTTPRPISYVVLDPELKARDPARFAALFAGFAAGYASEFSGDEAESTGEWQARIAGKSPPQPVMRIVVAVEQGDGDEHVIGGAAVEYYRAGACVLATYVYMSAAAAHSHRGHARSLLAEARKACRKLGPVRAILAEAEWPELLAAHGFSADEVAVARTRLRFFARIGARMLNFDYVQPPLGPGMKPVSYLRLFIVPTAGDDDAHATADDLRVAVDAFLAEFYAALAQEAGARADDEALTKQREQIASARPLLSPLPRLHLDDVALCFHFVEPLDGSAASSALLEEMKTYRCPVFHSMETDLLSRAYRMRRLFRTVCLTQSASSTSEDEDSGVAVEIAFPRRVIFQSENRTEERHWPLRRRMARAYLAPTFFFDARMIVWHLTLKADPEAPTGEAERWFDELDLITLLKLADDGADQEQQVVPAEDGGAPIGTAQAVKFRLVERDGGSALDLDGLLGAVAAVARERFPDAPLPRSAVSSRAATLQILGKPAHSSPPFFGMDDPLEREALCGIITGILDFDEIDDAEARDTLTPTVPLDHALMRVHRGVLVFVAEDDRAARTVAHTVGVSPYLIIPHATVLCNEHLLEPFESLASPGGEPTVVSAMSLTLKALEDTLRRKWVPDAFFYSTEQKLYEYALVQGGTAARRAKAEELLIKLKTNLQLAREAQREKFEAIVTGLLGAISVLALDSLVVEFMSRLMKNMGVPERFDTNLLGHAITFVLAWIVGLAIFAWKRPRRPTDEE